MHLVTFGTSGHRGIIGKTFTHNHVKSIGLAIGDYLNSQFESSTIIIGCDPRKGNSLSCEKGSFTHTLISGLNQKNIKVLIGHTFTATPVISDYIVKNKLQGGIILTASHNPPEYNGIKFNTSDGAPSAKNVTDIIEKKANNYLQNLPTFDNETISFTSIDAITPFCSDLKEKINAIGLDFSKYTESIVIDAKHGTAKAVWDTLAKTFNLKKISYIHEEPLSSFNNIETNPTKYESLDKLRNLQKETKSPIAIAHDPDCDRHVILDEFGSPLTPEETTCIIANFFVENKIKISEIAYTLASSQLVASLCKKLQLKLSETEVGFKYLSPILANGGKTENIVLAVESSGGFSTSFHTLEKCGFLPCLLMIIILNKTKKTISQLKTECLTTFGHFIFKESQANFKSEEKSKLVSYFANASLTSIQENFKDKIETIDNRDGLKIFFENYKWLLLRLSGTEPVARIYSESTSEEKSKSLINNGIDLLSKITG